MQEVQLLQESLVVGEGIVKGEGGGWRVVRERCWSDLVVL